MKEEKFKIANQTKKLIMDIDTYLVNFPRKEIELKQNIKNSSFKLLLLVYEANASSSTE